MEIGTHDTRDGVIMPEGWVTLPGGGIVPAKLDRATGWQDDRDTVNTAEVTTARVTMARATADYLIRRGEGGRPGADLVALLPGIIDAADRMAAAWDRLAELTGGEQ